MKNPIENRTLFTGDNLEVMRAMNSETVDLIYLDPPFNKKFVFPIGKGDSADFGFKDIWGWDSAADETNPFLPYAELYAFDELLAAEADGNPLIDGATARKVIRLLETMGDIAGRAEMAYLSFMAARLVEMRRLLKPSGSVYLHCDPTMSHSLKLLMDVIFGGGNFRNEIVWHYQAGTSPKTAFGRRHDVIFFYSKSKKSLFNRQSKPSLKPESYKKVDSDGRRYLVNGQGVKYYLDNGQTCDSVWTYVHERRFNSLASGNKERTGYPTQKPVALLERIVSASSNEGDLVVDPFCGCATTCVAAERLGRRWIGIDVASHAANLVKRRLTEETAQGKLGERVPDVHHRDFNKGECPMRTDLGEKRSKGIKTTLYGEQKGRCNLCRRHFEMQYFHLDHIIPKAKGGPDTDRNLQLLCSACNIVKSTRTMENAKKRLRELGYMSAPAPQ